MARINVTIPDELLVRLDDYSSSHYITRSAALCQGVSQLLLSYEAVSVFSQMKELLQAITEKVNNDKIDDNTMKEIEQLTLLCKAFTNNNIPH